MAIELPAVTELRSTLEPFLKTGRIEHTTPYSIFVPVRKILESGGISSSYKTAYLYCNWLVHPTLDRAAYKWVLENINEEIEKYSDINSSDMVLAVSKCLNVENLRRELEKILTDHGIDHSIISYDWHWSRLFQEIVAILIDQKISLENQVLDAKGVVSYAKATKYFQGKYKHPAVSFRLTKDTMNYGVQLLVVWSASVAIPSGGTVDIRAQLLDALSFKPVVRQI